MKWFGDGDIHVGKLPESRASISEVLLTRIKLTRKRKFMLQISRPAFDAETTLLSKAFDETK